MTLTESQKRYDDISFVRRTGMMESAADRVIPVETDGFARFLEAERRPEFAGIVKFDTFKGGTSDYENTRSNFGSRRGTWPHKGHMVIDWMPVTSPEPPAPHRYYYWRGHLTILV